MKHFQFNTERFAWLSLVLIASFISGVWRLQDAHLQCVAASQVFSLCEATKMTASSLFFLGLLTLGSTYAAGWLVKRPAHWFGVEPAIKERYKLWPKQD